VPEVYLFPVGAASVTQFPEPLKSINMLFTVPMFTIGACCLLCWSELVQSLYANLDIFLNQLKDKRYLYDFY